MPRTALHSSDIKIEQKADIGDDVLEREPEIVLVDKMPDKEYADALAFAEEPVKIRLEPSSEKNAATSFPVWVNGKPAEIFQNGKWREIGYLPVGQIITVKRKVVEIIARAKIDTIDTEVKDQDSERPNNAIKRRTSAVHSFSVLGDTNPIGAAWLTELIRRNM